MNIEEARGALWEDYLLLCEKYGNIMPQYEFGFALIQFNVRMLLDCAPRREVGLDTIKAAVEVGTKWHDQTHKEKISEKPVKKQGTNYGK